MSSKLFLIPSPIGENLPIETLPISIKKTISNLKFFIVENEKEARRFIKKICPDKVQSELRLEKLNKHTEMADVENFLNPCIMGKNMGLISDSGCPSIADPGSIIIEKAHQLGIIVKPLAGPSSIIMAMMSSGMNGQNFAFNGYLPIEKNSRKKMIKYFEYKSKKENQSQIFIETPYRNETVYKELINSLKSKTQLCIACNITEPDEFIKTCSISNWKKEKRKIPKKPAIFIIHHKNHL